MRLRLLLTTFLSAAILLPVSLHAQNRAAENRFWISAGAGGGWARVACAICRADRNLGPAAYLRVGVSAREGLLIGTEVNAWTREREDEREWTRALGAVAYLYPRAAGPLFVKGGVSYVGFSVDDVSIGTLGVQLGAGYEFRVGRHLYITNYLNLIASSFGTLHVDGDAAVRDVGLTLLQAGVGFTRR
jgi:hypothetical protein